MFQWALEYNLDKLTGDLIAGVTTALTVIPQGIGYAPLAGLPLQVSQGLTVNATHVLAHLF
jgi:MFS superfamily sulfate permease-like transporter